MTAAMFRVMLYTLLNDRGAVIMAFVLPVLFFLIMAEIFSSTSGGPVQLRVALADEVQSDLSRRLMLALQKDGTLEIMDTPTNTRAEVEALVAKGTADVGIVLPVNARALDDIGGMGPAPILIISDPVRGVAVAMLNGQIQKTYFEALPDVALGGVVSLLEEQFIELDASQRADLEAGLAEMGAAARDGSRDGWSFGAMLERYDIAGRSAATNNVAYYAGAVAFLFVLFSCMHGAVSLTEERLSGILDRLMTGPGGTVVLVNGKFMFLVLQGFVQMLLIFLTAWLVYDVDLPTHWAAWCVITVLACVAAAGLSLLVAAACRTPGQARDLWTVLALISSVVGGSMVPRFFMPLWLRDLGWFTPNTWVLEAYSALFWRDAGVVELLLPCSLLGLAGFVSLLAAEWMAVRRARL